MFDNDGNNGWIERPCCIWRSCPWILLHLRKRTKMWLVALAVPYLRLMICALWSPSLEFDPGFLYMRSVMDEMTLCWVFCPSVFGFPLFVVTPPLLCSYPWLQGSPDQEAVCHIQLGASSLTQHLAPCKIPTVRLFSESVGRGVWVQNFHNTKQDCQPLKRRVRWVAVGGSTLSKKCGWST